MSKITTISNWLIDAQSLRPGDSMSIYLSNHDGPPPKFPDMQAALHAQFGADTPIRIWKHGARIAIFIHSSEEDRAGFDKRNAAYTIKDGSGRLEIDHGFTRKLP